MEDHFTRLSDDIVLHVFNKFSDAKWLCRSSIVSKRFAALISQVHTVSVASTCWIFNSNPPRHEIEISQREEDLPLKFKAGHYQNPNQLLFSEYPVLKYLFKLKEIRSLHIELPSNVAVFVGDESLLKWGAKFGTKLESITFLHPASLREINESEGAPEEEEIENGMGVKTRDELMAMLCLREAELREAILMHLVPELPMLRCVVITDSSRRAVKLCLSGERLVEFRNSINLPTLTWTLPLPLPLMKRDPRLKRQKLRACYVPVLHLPLSGYVMKGVMLYMIKLFEDDGCEVDDDDDEAMLVAFEEEEEEVAFREAVVEILAKHKNSIHTIF